MSGQMLVDPLRDAKRRTADLRRHLRELISTVDKAIAALDIEMRKPSSVDRGKRVAQICNVLQLANDSAKRFGLGRGKRRRTTALPKE